MAKQYEHNLVDQDTYEGIQNILGLGNEPIPDKMIDAYFKVKCRLDKIGLTQLRPITWVLIAYFHGLLDVPEHMQHQIDIAERDAKEFGKTEREPEPETPDEGEKTDTAPEIPGLGPVPLGTTLETDYRKGHVGEFIGVNDKGFIGVKGEKKTYWMAPVRVIKMAG